MADQEINVWDSYFDCKYVPGRKILIPIELLDWGAGTVAVVAKKLNRNYIGIELNPDYVSIANKRIASTNKPLFQINP